MYYSYDCTRCDARMHCPEPLGSCPFPSPGEPGTVCGGRLKRYRDQEGTQIIYPTPSAGRDWFCQSCQTMITDGCERLLHFQDQHFFKPARTSEITA